MKPTDKIITLIREMMVGNVPATSGAFSSNGDAITVAGYDVPLGVDGRSKIARRLPPAYRKLLNKTKTKKR
jgi:hypothetical protein